MRFAGTERAYRGHVLWRLNDASPDFRVASASAHDERIDYVLLRNEVANLRWASTLFLGFLPNGSVLPLNTSSLEVLIQTATG
jgi:hypothetical protein